MAPSPKRAKSDAALNALAAAVREECQTPDEKRERLNELYRQLAALIDVPIRRAAISIGARR